MESGGQIGFEATLATLAPPAQVQWPGDLAHAMDLQ